jgi:type III pantothenate kinase
MLLAVDIGNSNTVVGVFRGDELVEHWRLSTDRYRTSDEVALLYDGLLGFAELSFTHNVHGIVISSVVPTVTETYREMVARYFPFPPVMVEPGIRTGLPLRYDNPKEIGADRIVNAVAAAELYGAPSIVVDFGTSTNFDVVDADGAFAGGAIAPGVSTSTEALVDRAARLPKVETIAPESAIGRTTTAAMQSGIVYGFAGQVDAIVTRIMEELGPGVTTVATGGLAPAILKACTTIDHHDPWLTLKGLRILWDRNTS